MLLKEICTPVGIVTVRDIIVKVLGNGVDPATAITRMRLTEIRRRFEQI